MNLAWIEARQRVLVASSTTWRSPGIVSALSRAGFDVCDFDGLTPSVADAVQGAGDDVVVAIVDDATDDWLRLVADLVRRHPMVRPLAMVELGGPDDFLAAIGSGVCGFVPPGATIEAIVRSVRSLTDHGVAIPRGMVPMLVAAVRHGRGHEVRTTAGTIQLTDREWEILQLLVQRRSTREMADQLYVSVGTIRSHMSTVLKKLGAADREEGIRLIESGQPLSSAQ